MIRVLILALGLALTACAHKPPVQAMAEARSAVATVKDMPGHHPMADRELKAAEQALEEASQALSAHQYDVARRKANLAKRHAQAAARLKEQAARHSR